MTSTHDIERPTMSPTIPDFLTNHASTRYRRAITPLSRVPATGHLGEFWHVAAARAGLQRVVVDRPADIDPAGPTDRTYAGWAGLVDRAATWLYAAGVRPWDRVVIMKANHLDVIVLACAAARIGAVPAMLAWDHSPENVRVLLTRLERPFLVTDRHQLVSAELDPQTLTDLTAATICVDGGDRADVIDLDSLRESPAAPVHLRPTHEPMVITHTSGTTGVPKLVMHSADSIYSLALVEVERWPIIGLRSNDVVAYGVSFCHQRMATALAAWITITPTLLMLSEPMSEASRQLVIDLRPTVVETWPNIFLAWEGFARDKARPFRNTRVYINSFDAIHTRTIRTFLNATERRLPVWVQSWSQTEAGAVAIRPYLRSTVRRIGIRPPVTQILGWPIPFLCRLRAVDPDTGEQVRRGQVGLIEISQPGRSLAYVGEQHRHDHKRNGWFWNTGDLGVIGKLGAVRLVDREIDRIPGGSAIEIEDVLLDRLPQATEIVILAVAGQKPVPVLSTEGDLAIDLAQWRKAVADLPELADPIQISWDAFPRTSTWKIGRVALREKLFSGASAVGLGRWT